MTSICTLRHIGPRAVFCFSRQLQCSMLTVCAILRKPNATNYADGGLPLIADEEGVLPRELRRSLSFATSASTCALFRLSSSNSCLRPATSATEPPVVAAFDEAVPSLNWDVGGREDVAGREVLPDVESKWIGMSPGTPPFSASQVPDAAANALPGVCDSATACHVAPGFAQSPFQPSPHNHKPQVRLLGREFGRLSC
eukprot:CAMPEP_0115485110 /NCGR_PEP_ID=MMETSP0271-20121206/59739_1 /TAXON_ID=71861 /ORGANISM="Scrippsiella trochoidea, Strain CCMP3099" /LENGTH=197 /DNA_ID=CAMNT_0002913055 /DNA_START=80 /DNA_END=671 /DNA_ORIENTATION=+